MPNINPDKKTNVQAAVEKLAATVENGQLTAFQDTMNEVADTIQQAVLADVAATKQASLSDEQLIANPKYNVRQLTAKEKEFYQAVAITDNTFKDTPMPETIYERVFEDLRAEHPLLSRIQFVNTNGVVQWVLRDGDVAAAQWGKLCGEIKKQLDMAFKVENLTANKLSAFVNMCKSMLAIGPIWLDRFVREMLMESISLGLETGIIAGTGVDQPIGMLKDLSAPIDPTTGYADKAAVAITDLSPLTIGSKMIAPLTNGGKVNVNVQDILFIVNPLDYWSKLFAHLAFRTPEGNYVLDKTSIGATLVMSAAMPQGKMIVGKARNYFLGLAMPQNVSYSDDYRFLEDDRVYIAKLIGHGKPVNNTSFQVFDISGITGAPQA